MKNGIVFILSMVGILSSCDLKRYEAAQRTADSLRIEFQKNKQLTETMIEVGVLMDSIDASRNALKINMIEGTNYDSYASRMREINQYVRKSERKIEALERAARKSNDADYANAIRKLRGDLQIRDHELAALKEQVSTYKNENDNLISTVGLQRAEIEDKLNQIKSKQNDVNKLQDQVNQLLVKSSHDQGEDLYVRAMAVEETANRTKFAPRKKKRTQKQALDLYKMALVFGNDSAQVRIAALEKKM